MQKIYPLSGPEQAPKSGNTPKKLIILLHGLGADGHDLFGLVPYFAKNLPDAFFISLDAPFPCDMAPFGKQWFSLQVREEEAMLEGINHIMPSLIAFIQEKTAALGLEMKDVALIGFSQGTMLSLHTALRLSSEIAGVVAYSGALIAPQLLKEQILSKPEICLIHGEADEVVPFIAFEEAKTALEKHGIPLQAYSNPELGHGIDPAGIEIGKKFLDQVFSSDREIQLRH
jgi:phospholipase/carboxylesterase